MQRRRSGPWRLGVVAGALVMVLTAGFTGSMVSAGAEVSVPDRPAPNQVRGRHVVTLITGDRVMVRDGRPVTVVPGDGRRGIGFRTLRVDGRLQVMPSDAERLVASGRLDRRLFDITGLIEAGLDDARSRSLPLIVTYGAGGAGSGAGAASLRAGGAEVVRELPAIDGAAVRVSKDRGFSFMYGQRLAAGFERIWLDGRRRTSLDVSVPQIGGPAAWQAGYTGKGVTVAVLDTGVDTTHPDLDDRVVEARNFTEEPAGDQVGHGTHVASTIAGTGEKYRGVAPDATVLDGKVCESFGCLESAIIAGMQWAASEKHADVINLSLGGRDFPETDPLEEAVNTLTAETGALFVIAAGNSGPKAMTVDSPGSADAALTVGAVDKSDAIAGFSSRGPRVGDGAIKPEITAPGVGIVAAEANTGGYLSASGTSMATPHVVGAAAVLKQQHPDWDAGRLKTVLMASAKAHAEQSAFDQGAGRVDVARAIKQTVVTDTGSVSFGTAVWPHGDDTPVVKQLTYRNLGSSAVTLNLQASMTDPKGAAAPAGALTLSASSVTVPAGGTGTVTVTSNTRHDGPDGAYSGRVLATGPGDVSVTTPLGVNKEAESYNLTVSHIDRDGRPSGAAATLVLDLDSPLFETLYDEDGTATVRLAKGRFHVMSLLTVETSPGQFEVHQMVQPVLRLDHDVALTVDTRLTKPVTTTVPRPDAELGLVSDGWSLDTSGRDIDVAVDAYFKERLFIAPLGDPASAPDRFTAWVSTQWAGTDSPYTYNLLNTRDGNLWQGFHRVVKDSELALVRSRHNVQANPPKEYPRRMWKGFFGTAPGMPFGTNAAVLFRFDPGTTVSHYLEAGATAWSGTFIDGVEIDEFPFYTTDLLSPERSYRAGRTYTDRWNAAVFGPGFGTALPVDRWAVRTGDRISLWLPMYSDQDGHAGFSETTDSPSTKLYRNGELVADVPTAGGLRDHEVPSGKGEFRLVVSASRPTISKFSTRMDAEWTFGSQTTSTAETLPLWAVRYFPAVDNQNVVERRPVTLLPVRLETESGARVGSVSGLEIRVSGDDGTTWSKAAVRRTGDNRYVAVFATPKGGYVSLKAKAADSNGNTTEQTIIRAYALR